MEPLFTEPVNPDDFAGWNWYLEPKKRNADTVVEPYVDTGVKLLMTSFLAPVQRHGKWIGIAGVDRSIESVRTEIDRLKVLDSGHGMVVTGKGTFVAAPDRKAVGVTTLQKLAKRKKIEGLDAMARAIKAGKAGHAEATDPFNGEESVLFWAPVESSGWAFIASAPKDEVLADVAVMRRNLILLGLAALILVGGLVIFIASRLTRPVVEMADAADRISEGDLDIQIAARGGDEIGRMAAAFGRMIEYLRGTSAAAESIARGDLSTDVTPKSERDVLGTSVAGMARALRELVGELSRAAQTVGTSSQQTVTDLAGGRPGGRGDRFGRRRAGGRRRAPGDRRGRGASHGR